MIAARPPADAGPLAALFGRGFPEAAHEVAVVEGRIPAYVRGTYYVNGPARFGRGDVRYRNWLDGDGMVCALRLDAPGHARYACRYVRTRKLEAEEAAGRPLFRAFGTSFPGDRLRRGILTESPANVSIIPFDGRLLAFGEQSLPYAIDPETLETRGIEDFGAALNEVSPFSAHPKRDESAGELINFGISFSPREPRLNYYRLDARGRLLARASVPLEAPYSVHDFAVSRHFAVFHLGPYVLDVEALLRGGSTTIDALRWEPERSARLLVLDRETGRELARPTVEAGYSLHTIRAFERGDGLVVDLIEYDRPLYPQYQPMPAMFRDVLRGRPVRRVIDVATWRIEGRQALPDAEAPDFPCLDPRDASGEGDVWTLAISAAARRGPKFFDRLVRLGWRDAPADGGVQDVYIPPAGRFLGGEPAIIPDPGDPSNRSILCHEFDPIAGESWYLILDADALGRGPTARLALGRLAPPGFHAWFLPDESGAPSTRTDPP